MRACRRSLPRMKSHRHERKDPQRAVSLDREFRPQPHGRGPVERARSRLLPGLGSRLLRARGGSKDGAVWCAEPDSNPAVLLSGVPSDLFAFARANRAPAFGTPGFCSRRCCCIRSRFGSDWIAVPCASGVLGPSRRADPATATTVCRPRIPRCAPLLGLGPGCGAGIAKKRAWPLFSLILRRHFDLAVTFLAAVSAFRRSGRGRTPASR